MQGRKKHEAEQAIGNSITLENDWQVQITEKVNFLETKMISMDKGLAGAGENIKKILEHLLKNSSGVPTTPRKKLCRGPQLSPVNDNQRSAISEIARAQHPRFDHMSPKGHSQMRSHGDGAGRDGDDDETQGYDNEVVDLGDDAQHVIPCTQMNKGNANFGKGKGIVVIDSQSGGEDNDGRSRGARMEEYQKRRPQQLQGQQDRGKKSKGATEAERRRPQNSYVREDGGHKTSTRMYNLSEEEEDDSETETMSPPKRSERRSVAIEIGEGEGATTAGGRPRSSSDRNTAQASRLPPTSSSERVPPTTQTYRRQKNCDEAHGVQPSKGSGAAGTEVPHSLNPRKNGVSFKAYLLVQCLSVFTTTFMEVHIKLCLCLYWVHVWVCRSLYDSIRHVGSYTQTFPGRLLQQEGRECLESPEQENTKTLVTSVNQGTKWCK